MRDGLAALPPHPEAAPDRRSFLRLLGAGGVLTILPLAGCGDDVMGSGDEADAITLDFSTDAGALNYAYALEQLEAAFYTMAVASPFAGATADEQQVLRDLRDHEVAHREFLRAALGSGAIGQLAVDFGNVDFGSRQSVLQTAMAFEDLGVSAYNGAGQYLSNPEFLTVAGKIVSVEARHASVIRTLTGSPFAPSAFDDAMAPSSVLQAAAPFIQNEITIRNA